MFNVTQQTAQRIRRIDAMHFAGAIGSRYRTAVERASAEPSDSRLANQSKGIEMYGIMIVIGNRIRAELRNGNKAQVEACMRLLGATGKGINRLFANHQVAIGKAAVTLYVKH